MRTLLLLGAFALLTTTTRAQVVIEENFPYAVGTSLAATGNWTVHSGTANPIFTVARNLTFGAYPSASGNAVEVKGSAVSREDVNRPFTAITSGDLYVAALVRVDSSGTTEDYFLHIADASVAGTGFRGRVYTRDQGTGFQFGIAKAGSPVFAPTTYAFGTTYLVVARYSIVEGNNNDVVSLYVFAPGESFATLPAAPSAVASDNLTATDIVPATVELRQGSQNYGMTVDGLRVTRSFNSVGTASEPSLQTMRARLDLVGAQPAPRIRMRLTVDVPGAVRVAAYDLLGREVAMLLEGDLAGSESREITFGGVPAGVYVIRATGAGFAASRSVVLQ